MHAILRYGRIFRMSKSRVQRAQYDSNSMCTAFERRMILALKLSYSNIYIQPD